MFLSGYVGKFLVCLNVWLGIIWGRFLSTYFEEHILLRGGGGVAQKTPHVTGKGKAEGLGELLMKEKPWKFKVRLPEMTIELPSRSLTVSFPLKSSRNPIGKYSLPTTIFQGRTVKLRWCTTKIHLFLDLDFDGFSWKLGCLISSSHGIDLQKVDIFPCEKMLICARV